MKPHKIEVGKNVFLIGEPGYSYRGDRQLRCESCKGDGLESLEGKILAIAEMREYMDHPRPCLLCSQTGREPMPFSEVWGL